MKIVICCILSLANCAPNWDVGQGSDDYASTGQGFKDYAYTGTGSEDYAYTGQGSEDYTSQGSQDYIYTSDTCLAPEELCLSFSVGSMGECCGGAAACNVFDASMSGYSCAATGQGSEDYAYTGQGSEDYTSQGSQAYSYTSDTCLAPGELCLSFSVGSIGECCGGAAACYVFDASLSGYSCAATGQGSEDNAYTGQGSEDYTSQGSQDYSYTSDTCLAPEELCLSFSVGSIGECCGGAAACNVFDASRSGYSCAATGQGSEDYAYNGQGSEDTCLAPGELCLSFADGSAGQCCGGAGACNVFNASLGYFCA